MRTLLAVLMLILVCAISRADEIVLKNGRVLKNCEIVDTTGTAVKYRQIYDTVGTEVRYVHFDSPTPTIGSIEKSQIQQLIFSKEEDLPLLGTEITPIHPSNLDAVRKIQATFPTLQLRRIETRYTHLGYLAVTVLAGVLAIDCLADASIYGDNADTYKKLGGASTGNSKDLFNQIASDYGDIQSRKTIVGVGCAVVAGVSLLMAFQTDKWAVFSNGMEIKVQYTP